MLLGSIAGTVKARVDSATSALIYCDNTLSRHYMPSTYSPDEAWARVVQGAVEIGTRYLEEGGRDFRTLHSVMIEAARPGLQALPATSGGSRNHTENFGIPRDRIRGVDLTVEFPQYAALAREVIEASGVIEEDKFEMSGREYTQRTLTHRQTHRSMCLGSVSTFATNVLSPTIEFDFEFIEISSASTGVIAPTQDMCQSDLDDLIELKQQLEDGAFIRSRESLHLVQAILARVFWLVSNGWFYSRGSSGLADMTVKAIADWFDIAIPKFKADVNPNIESLLTSVSRFQILYPRNFVAAWAWRTDVCR